MLTQSFARTSHMAGMRNSLVRLESVEEWILGRVGSFTVLSDNEGKNPITKAMILPRKSEYSKEGHW